MSEFQYGPRRHRRPQVIESDNSEPTAAEVDLFRRRLPGGMLPEPLPAPEGQPVRTYETIIADRKGAFVRELEDHARRFPPKSPAGERELLLASQENVLKGLEDIRKYFGTIGEISRAWFIYSPVVIVISMVALFLLLVITRGGGFWWFEGLGANPLGWFTNPF